MCVGLTLEENKITVVFLGDGVYLMLENKPELISSGIIHKHIETLQLLKHRLIVEKEVFEKLGKDNIQTAGVRWQPITQNIICFIS